METVQWIVVCAAIAVFATFAFRARARDGVKLGFGVRNGAGREFGIGVAIGLVAMLAVFAVEAATGVIELDGIELDWKILGAGLLILVLLAAAEEAVFRGLLLPGLLVVLKRPWLALALTALLFGVNHLSQNGVTVLSFVSACLGGVMYGVAYLVSGRIWLPMGIHLAWNYVQGSILGFPVSGNTDASGGVVQQHVDAGPWWVHGGDYGPEGGIVGIAARLLVVGLVLVAARWLVRDPDSVAARYPLFR